MKYFQDDEYGSFGGLNFPTVPLDEVNAIIQGIPYDSASSGKKGSSLTPSAIRMISKDMQTISRRGIDFNSMILRDVGDIMVNPVDSEKTRFNIEKSMNYLVAESKAPFITIGGDHSITYPIIKSLTGNGTVGIIWFDAHRDLLNDFAGSKYSHGCPLRRIIELDQINTENILLVGTRYMDNEEQKIIDSTKISEMKMVDLEDNAKAIEEYIATVKDIASKVDHLYVSVDIDVLDPAFTPGTGTPVAGGMTTSDLMTYLWKIPVPVRAFDLVEISPLLDPSGITIKAGLAIITEMLATIKRYQ